VYVPLTNGNIFVIATNLLITGASAALFLHVARDHMKPADSFYDIPPVQLLLIPFWILADEIWFFHAHRFAHRKEVRFPEPMREATPAPSAKTLSFRSRSPLRFLRSHTGL
jgi:hypothetical protein